jgi:aspartyl/asparaginyl beta-hydroxylase (cupin superfamily)
MIRSLMEKMITRLSRDGNRTFFEAESFPWVAQIEAGSQAIRGELNALLVHRDAIPNFQDISEDQKVLTEGEQWKTFFLYAYGHKAEENCARCPETARLLGCIPGMKTAMFSILAPKKHVPEHRGPYKGVLRYHLGLIIPEPRNSCRIRVGEEIRWWVEGKSLIFDDSHMHEVWNDSDSWRVVLFVDFLRPLPFPLSLLNRMVIWRISRTAFITDAIERVRQAGSNHGQEGLPVNRQESA